MKYVLVTTRLGDAGQAQIQYPAIYDAVEVDRKTQGELVYKGHHDQGDATGEVLMCMEDATADKYATDPDVEILTEAQADSWLVANPNLTSVPEEQVTDVDRLIAIQAKKVAAVALSQEDLDALDPDNAMRGINRKVKNAQTYFAKK